MSDLTTDIKAASIKLLRVRSLPADISAFLRKSVKAADQYTAQYRLDLKALIADALNGRITEAEFKKKHRALIVALAPEVFYQALADQGLDDDEIADVLDEEQYIIDDWITQQKDSLAGFAAAIFALAALGAGNVPTEQYDQLIARSELWVDSLTWLSQMGKTAGKGDPYLTFDGEDGVESCAECQDLKGRREKRSWWISSGYIDRPNDLFSCGRWDNCHHSYFYDDGTLAIA